MPIYEYYCAENRTIYSFFARSSKQSEAIPRCPENADWPMERLVSGFSITTNRPESDGGEGDDPFANISDAQAEALMADLEKDLGGINEDNPDPRLMGKIMRRLCEATGKKLPEEVRELMGRLESGEDLERLEGDFGELMENEDFDFDLGPDGSLQKLKEKLQGPRRDPELYELSDYL